jgi:hypothetical protein
MVVLDEGTIYHECHPTYLNTQIILYLFIILSNLMFYVFYISYLIYLLLSHTHLSFAFDSFSVLYCWYMIYRCFPLFHIVLYLLLYLLLYSSHFLLVYRLLTLDNVQI